MKIKWLIEKSVLELNKVYKFVDLIKSKGMIVQSTNYIPFNGGLTLIPEISEEDFVIFFGSINAVKYIQNKYPKWIPNSWCNWDILKCSYYLSYFGEFSIHQNYCFLPLSEIFRKKEKLYKNYGIDNQIFIKPDTNDKVFSGGLVALENFTEWWNDANLYKPDKHCLCLISEPSKIIKEYRLIVSDNKVLTGSRYKINGEIEISKEVPKEIIDCAENIMNSVDFVPHPIYCLDLAKLDNKTIKMLEIGSVNCAGLYDCDLELIIDKCSEIAEL